VAAADDVGSEAPDQGAEEHARVEGDGHARLVADFAELAEGRLGNDGLQEDDERVDGISRAVSEVDQGFWGGSLPKAVEEEQLGVVGCPPDFVNNLGSSQLGPGSEAFRLGVLTYVIHKIHLPAKNGVQVLLAQQVVAVVLAAVGGRHGVEGAGLGAIPANVLFI
jgi:hypothetical protein